jgi:hypothetical protein
MKKKFISLILSATLLISGCSNSEYQIKVEDLDPNQVVEIKDEELELIIRGKISKSEEDILVSDMEEIYSININYEEFPVKDISGLEYAVNLNDFSYRYGEDLNSLDPLSYLENLEYINISYSTIANQPSEFNTPVLDRVSFIETNISDYNFLSNVNTITQFTAIRSEVKSIEFLNKMSNLETLNLSENEIVDISPLKNKKNLVDVKFHQNQINDISALQTCESLETLNISYNHVNNIEFLYDLDYLYELTMYEELDAKIIPREQIDVLIDSGVEVLYHE